MTSPLLTITPEPSEGGAIVYLPLAPGTINSPSKGQLSLVVTIQNNESAPVHVNQLTVSFPDAASITPSTIPLSLDIPASGQWRAAFERQNNIIIPVPAPQEVTISLLCDGFSDPAALTMPLLPHENPVADGSYSFPARSNDLSDGEYWQGISASHASGTGTQLFAHDLIVVAYDTETGQWTGNLPDTDGSENEHSRTWGKPIYAMADGVVIAFRNDIPNNPTTVTGPVEGDSFWIQHDSEVMLYAHFDPASMNPDLLAVGATVLRGTYLGRAGNSGNSSGPHLHIHALNRTGTMPWQGPLRPILFNDMDVIDRSEMQPPNDEVGWVHVEGQGLPDVVSLILPQGVRLPRPDLGIVDERNNSGRMIPIIWLIIIATALVLAGIFIVYRILR
jgi:hypothetical protein